MRRKGFIKATTAITQNSNKSFKVLGSEVLIAEDEIKDTDVDKYCKEKIFFGFKKTLKKLDDKEYQKTRSKRDILKKLFKKAVTFMEAGMQSIVVEIGNVVAKMVAHAYPIPEYKIHNE